jgi:hypothetical protein
LHCDVAAGYADAAMRNHHGLRETSRLLLGSMRLISSKRLMPLATGTLLALLVSGAGMPRSAWAGCNHLVNSRFDTSFNLDLLDELTPGNPVSHSAQNHAERSQGPRRDRPCSGLSCSGRVPLPVSTSSQKSESSDQWMALASPSVELSSGADARRSDDSGLLPIRQADSIFHPPRG